MTQFRGVILAALLIFPSLSAHAHSTLKTSSPVSGAILEMSPTELTLTFNEPTRLTSIESVSPAGERPHDFSPKGSAVVFNVVRPDFSVGRNEVHWRALSRDGHVVEGTIIIVIRTKAP